MKYQTRVNENLSQMNSNVTEWQSVPIKKMVETKDKIMPEFDFPDYKPAPSLYRNSGVDMCCELCGTAIKFAYYIQNDSKRWIMLVGSECVTHFGAGESGKEIVGKATAEQKRETMRQAIKVRKELYFNHSRQQVGEWGKVKIIWDNPDTKKRYDYLKEITDGRYPDPPDHKMFDQDSDRSVSAWYSKHIAKLKLILEETK